jgi:hypothetical protein
MPPRFSFNTDLTSSVNGALEAQKVPYLEILLQCDLEASDDSEVLPRVPHGVLQEFSDFNAI